MKTVVNVICIVLLLGLFIYPKVSLPNFSWPWEQTTNEIVKPDNLHGFDVSIPAVLTDKTQANELCGLFSGLADELERDGIKSKPEIKYASNVRDAFREAVNIEFDGKNLNTVTSGLGDKIGPEFEKVLPDGSAELTNESRKAVVELFHAAAYGCSLVK